MSPVRQQGPADRATEPGRWLERTSRACGTAWQRVLQLDTVWAGLFVLVGLWVLLPAQTFFSSRVEAGEIASRAFVASRDLLEEDGEKTLAEQDNARASVLPVYDFEPAIARDLENEMMQLFEVGRASLLDELGVEEIDSAQSEDNDQAPTSLLSEFLAASQLKIEPDQVAVLERREFSAALEDRLRSMAAQLLRLGLVRDKDRLLANRERGITVRDLETGSERVELDLYRRVSFPDEAQELIDTESQRWTDLSRSDRANAR